jgi:glycine/D-amino acid oxidase-like deaminating enzyme
MNVIICGGGVIGAAIAYELSKRNVTATIVERWQIAGSASGKSGGFLARDWCDGSPVEQLAHRSFDLHARWATELGNPYGFRTVETISCVMSTRRRLSGNSDNSLAPWLAQAAAHRSRIGGKSTTAQLDPEAFTRTLAAAAVRNGGAHRQAIVIDLAKSDDLRVTGVVLADGTTIEADAVVLAMGPWSLLAAQWIPLPPVYGLKGHSLVFKPETPLPPEAVFAEFETADGEILTPEIVPRADGTIYICGLSGTDALPVDPAGVEPEDGGCDKLRDIAIELVPQLASARVLAEQACYRPITQDGLPLIGPVPDHDGIYVATGHSVWGMLNAPGTGEALAELIINGETTHVDLAPFALDRMAPLDPADLELRR